MMHDVRLADAWIHGLRRFGGDTPHRVRIDAKLVCLIGANEAGKSTIIDAMEFAHSGEPVAPADRTRREAVPNGREIVRLRYRVEAADRDALADIESEVDPRSVQWFEVIHHAGGRRRVLIEPLLRRARGRRNSMRTVLRGSIGSWWPEPSPDDEPPGEAETRHAPDRDLVDSLIDDLSEDPGTLADSVISQLRELAAQVESENEVLAADLRELADHEGAQHPTDVACDRLWDRTPDFIRFDDAARELASEYDLTTAAASPGRALRHLAALASLDLGAMHDAIAAGETGTVRDLREGANRVLAERISAWQQDPSVVVAFENDGMILRVHVQSGTGPTMPFHERSDGLRQFVALVALTAQEHRIVPPILLIDEIETHLHYDAQADLIQVLAQQSAVGQIIYSTHSAASLPEDLGLGVRVVEGVGTETLSTVRQNFWRDQDPGMGALLMAMGAASLAFVPLRPAVIAEGGSDLVLLPSLMREAMGSDHLPFAVVPGSSSTPPDRIAGLDLHGVRTVWVLDADDGGRTRRDQLIAGGIPPERVLLLADDDDLEIEDFVVRETYCAAVGMYVADVGGSADDFTLDDLPTEPCRRHDAVVAWCKTQGLHPPGKIAIANKVIDLVGKQGLLDPAHAERMHALRERVVLLLGE